SQLLVHDTYWCSRTRQSSGHPELWQVRLRMRDRQASAGISRGESRSGMIHPPLLRQCQSHAHAGPRRMVVHSGPASDPPGSSLNLRDLIEYTPKDVADAILAFPGMTLQSECIPNWWQWWAEWRMGKRHIGVGMTLLDTEPVAWSGSPM